ncbi:thioesterase [Vibrio sp. vnigr-6D03]|uniref:thioesterase II family protein n=1 Tax=Vibrio sp. vnigr-6D03 TaxID=2058088 RepID=UPI000C31BA82|nr:alpha/beta fold hydrolase [Vibrio sp. vnigr-6D03]PKF77853.1 thioesterase [Vibrio sp. vnigr-6D03]
MTCLPFPDVKTNPEIDLFCLPYAGGSSAVFSKWDAMFPDWISVRPVELPGRGSRLNSSLMTCPTELSIQLADELAERIERPWAIFGHSLGAALGYRIAHIIESEHPLLGFFPSGRHAPTCADPAPLRAHLSDEALIEEVRSLNGAPPELLENREFMNMVLPIIRADFELSERGSLLPPLGSMKCGMQVFGSTDDPEVPIASLKNWKDVAGADFSQKILPGDHFFLHHESQCLSMRDSICDLLSKALAESKSTVSAI